jgi:hypothetical protein
MCAVAAYKKVIPLLLPQLHHAAVGGCFTPLSAAFQRALFVLILRNKKLLVFQFPLQVRTALPFGSYGCSLGTF